MVPYFGRHSAKMFIRGKPIRFGYKLWSLCGSDGYPYHLQVYKGKAATSSNEPLGTRVVNHMVEVVRENSYVAKHHFFFDNVFTSHNLLSDLESETWSESYWHSEGKPDRRSKPWLDIHQRNEKEHAWNDFRCDGTVFMCKWNDNSVVTVASNCQTHTLVHEVQSRVKGQPVNNVQQPHLIHAYNQGMGGVDLLDRMLASYRPSIRGKKWNWPLFTNALNVTVVAALRILCKIAESPMSHLDFRREIAICWLKMSMVSRLQVGGGPRVNLPDDVRFDWEDHEKVAASQGMMQGLQNKLPLHVCKVQRAAALWPRVKMLCHLPHAQWTVSIILWWSHDVFQPSDQAKHSYQRLFDSNKTNFIWTCVWKLLCQNSLYKLFLYILGSLAANVPAWEHSCISESVDWIDWAQIL